jgi:hypothetical protein
MAIDRKDIRFEAPAFPGVSTFILREFFLSSVDWYFSVISLGTCFKGMSVCMGWPQWERPH